MERSEKKRNERRKEGTEGRVEKEGSRRRKVGRKE